MTSTYDLMLAARTECTDNFCDYNWASGVGHHDLIEVMDDHRVGGLFGCLCLRQPAFGKPPAEPPVFPWQGARR